MMPPREGSEDDMSKRLFAAAEKLVREVNAFLDYGDDEDMELASDVLWTAMSRTGKVNAAMADDLVQHVDSHLGYHDDADMGRALERLRDMLPDATPAEREAFEAAHLRAAAERLVEKVDEHLVGWEDAEMKAARDALDVSMEGGAAVDPALLDALATEVEDYLAVDEVDALRDAVARVRKTVPAPESAPTP
jgi:hypothetical protein